MPTSKKPKKKQAAHALHPDLTDTELDLVRHLEEGYELETDQFGGEPVLKRVKDQEAIRPASATRSTVKALEEKGLIAPAEGDDPLKVVWRLNKNDRKT